MAEDYIATSNGSKIPTINRTATAGEVKVPESVASFDDGTETPARVKPDNPLPVRGKNVSVSVEFTRPANATAYTAGDVVSNDAATTVPMNFASFARVTGGAGYIVGARLITDKKSITPRIRVHLFNAADPTLAADNVAWKELYAEEAKRIGQFDLPAMTTGTDATGSTMSRAEDLTLRLPFIAVSRSVYAVLEALDGFTPASGEKFTLTLIGELN